MVARLWLGGSGNVSFRGCCLIIDRVLDQEIHIKIQPMSDIELLQWVNGYDLSLVVHLVALYVIVGWYTMIKLVSLTRYGKELNRPWRFEYLI